LPLNYEALPREFPRRYVPRNLKFDWESLSKLYEELKQRKLLTRADMERWLKDESELYAVVTEERSVRMVRNTTQTDNPEYERAYLQFVQELEPKLKPARFELDKRFVASPARNLLPKDFYRVMVRSRNNSVAIFRQENVELEKQDSELRTKYEKISAAMTVAFRGEERTLNQMVRFLDDADRKVRREAWELSERRRLADAEKLDQIYEEQVKLRAAIGKNAGFDNFRDYTFAYLERFDYTPQDCYDFHDAVEEHFVPLRRELDRRRMEKLGVETLRPWDASADPEGRPPLRPYRDVSELVQGCAKVFEKVDPEFAGYFSRLVDLNLLDLESRKGKRPGGYQAVFNELRLPFIFTNGVGRDQDVRTLCHEAGHSFQTFLLREKDYPFDYLTGYGSEIAEVASTSMELISGSFYEGTFYDADESRRSNLEEHSKMVWLFCWVATIDSFQHWVYTHPEHSREERQKEWLRLFRRFLGLESWEGYEESERSRWQRQLHLFEYPFYYMEYAIAGLGALGIWTKYRREPKEAIAAYKSALSLGGSKPLPEIFGAADLPWGFGSSSVRGYADELKKVIAEES
jgi:oligoendopeptidase F